MLKELKSISIKKSLYLIIIYAALAIILSIYCVPNVVKLIAGPADLDSVSMDNLEGQYVKSDIYYIIDNFSSYYSTTKSGTETIEKNYYILPVGEKEYIALEVMKSGIEPADKVMNESYDYYLGKRDNLTSSIKINGTISKMDDKELIGFYNDWFEASGAFEGATQEQIDEIVLPYVLKSDYVGSMDIIWLYICIIVILFSAISTFYLLITRLLGVSLSPIKKYLKHSTSEMTEERMESDFASASVFGSTRIGKEWTYFFQGSKAYVLENKEIIWAYLENTTHRVNGIKTNTTKALIVYTRNRKKYTCMIGNEESIQDVLKIYSNTQPHMVIGYSNELKALFNKNFDAFLNLPFEREAAVTENTEETVDDYQ